eukprot:13257770-Alexandrium_andersonii.AAC.1
MQLMVSVPVVAPVSPLSALCPAAELAAEREGVRSDLGLQLGSECWECWRLPRRVRLALLLEARRRCRPRAARAGGVAVSYTHLRAHETSAHL